MKHIATIRKTATEELHVDLHEWKSEVYVDIRIWHRAGPAPDGDLHPTTRGLRINAELLTGLRSAFDEAIRVIESGEEIGTTRETAETAGEVSFIGDGRPYRLGRIAAAFDKEPSPPPSKERDNATTR